MVGGGRPPPPAIAEAAWTRTVHPDRCAASAGHGGGRSRVASFCCRVCSLLPCLLTVPASWTATSSASCTRRRFCGPRPPPGGAASGRRPGAGGSPRPRRHPTGSPERGRGICVGWLVSSTSRRPGRCGCIVTCSFFLLLTTAAVWRPHASWMRMCRRRPWCMACGGYVGSGARRAWEGGMGKRRGSCGDEDRGGLLMAEERVCIADDGERGGGGGSGMFLVFRRSGVTMFAGPVFPEELCPVTMHFRLARGHPAGLFGTSHADSASYAVPVPSVFVSLPCSFASV